MWKAIAKGRGLLTILIWFFNFPSISLHIETSAAKGGVGYPPFHSIPPPPRPSVGAVAVEFWVPAGSRGSSVFALAVLSSNVSVHRWVTAEFLLMCR